MTDVALHAIPDDDLRRRIMQAELLLDCLYAEKYRRLAYINTDQTQPEWRKFSRKLERRRNDPKGD